MWDTLLCICYDDSTTCLSAETMKTEFTNLCKTLTQNFQTKLTLNVTDWKEVGSNFGLFTFLFFLYLRCHLLPSPVEA